MNPIQTIDYIRILPELVLTAFGIIVMMADPLLKPGASRKGLGLIALAGTIAAIAATDRTHPRRLKKIPRASASGCSRAKAKMLGSASRFAARSEARANPLDMPLP